MRGRGRSLAKASTSIYGLKLGEAVVSTLLAATLARLLGPSGYGEYTFAVVVAMLGAVVARSGLPPLVIRETARALANNKGSAQPFWQWARRTTLMFAGVVAAALGTLCVLIDHYDLGEPSPTVYGALALIPLLALTPIHTARLRGRGVTTTAQIVRALTRPSCLFVLAGGCWLAGTSLMPGSALLLNLIAALITLSCAVFLVRAKESAEQTNDIIGRAWLRQALPFAAAQGLQRLNSYADILLLGLLATTEAVGNYRVATQIALIVSMALNAVAFASTPLVASLYESGEYAKLQHLARRAAQAATLTAVVAVIGIAAVGRTVLSYAFGTDFVNAFVPLLILAIGQSINSAFGLCAAILNMTGHQGRVSLTLGVATAANIALNLALIPPFGIVGAATATAASTVIWNGLLWGAARQRLGINTACFGASKARHSDT